MAEKIEIDVETCNDCGELLVKDAATPFFLTIEQGKVAVALCNSCFGDRLIESYTDVVKEATDSIMEELRLL